VFRHGESFKEKSDKPALSCLAGIAAFAQYSQYSARLGRLRVESKPGLNTSRIVEVLRVFPRQ
jgi:hypothetical protein